MIKGQIVYNRNGKEGTANFEFNGSRDELEQYINDECGYEFWSYVYLVDGNWNDLLESEREMKQQ